MSKHYPVLCPSAMCKSGNWLFGIVGRDGLIPFIEKPVSIDDDFVSMARQGRPPEKRFRFTTPCLEKGCGQWKNGRCSVGDEVVAVLGAVHFHSKSNLPACSIRDACRWHRQTGDSACFVCLEVITDTRTSV